MKRLFAIFTLAALVLTACDDKKARWTQVVLEGSESTELSIPLSAGAQSISVGGGSGDYSVAISEPSVADARIEATDGAGIVLIIEPKKEGDAVVTVTDRKSGLFARCSLSVTDIISLRITDILTDVDADTPEIIEVDLATNVLMPEGGGFEILHDQGDLPDGNRLLEVAFVDADNNEIARGTVTIRKDSAEIRPAYSFLPLDNQIYYSRKWEFDRGEGDVRVFDVFIVRNDPTRANVIPAGSRELRLYEDLTEYYRTKFPDAGVRSVARAMISPGSM